MPAQDCGVYRIVNTVSGTTYIGSSLCVRKRWVQHRSTLEKGKHQNKHLQFAWNKYGGQVFVFERLLECLCEERGEREQRFIDAYILHGLALYNTKQSANSLVGFRYRHSEEARAKMREFSKIRLPHSVEHRAKIGEANKRRIISVETREKMRLSQRGWVRRRPSALTVEKMREARRRYWATRRAAA